MILVTKKDGTTTASNVDRIERVELNRVSLGRRVERFFVGGAHLVVEEPPRSSSSRSSRRRARITARAFAMPRRSGDVPTNLLARCCVSSPLEAMTSDPGWHRRRAWLDLHVDDHGSRQADDDCQHPLDDPRVRRDNRGLDCRCQQARLKAGPRRFARPSRTRCPGMQATSTSTY